MKKPYLKKVGVFSGYKVFYVSGYWVRNNIDRQFPNFGYSNNCPYIPEDEFWIDKENGKKEVRFWIDYLIAFKRFLAEGKEYSEAANLASKIEQRERSKQKSLQKIRKIKLKDKLLKKIHKKRLLKNYTNHLKIWVVRGDLVRSLFDLDFNQGGHGLVYNFIPKNEIWVDDDLYKKETPFVLIHELHEILLMKKGWKYDSGANTGFMSRKEPKSAHFESEDLEFWTREHKKSTKRILLREIKKNEDFAEKELEEESENREKLAF